MDKESFFEHHEVIQYGWAWSNLSKGVLDMITPERIWSPLNTSIFYYFISWYITWLWDSLRFFDILYLT